MAISITTILAFSPGVLVGFILTRSIIGALTRSDSDSSTNVHDSTKLSSFSAEKGDGDVMTTIESNKIGASNTKADGIEKHFRPNKILVDLQEFHKSVEAFTHLKDGSTATPESEKSEPTSQVDDNV